MNKKQKVKLLQDIAAKKKKIKDLIPKKVIIRRRVIGRDGEVKRVIDRTVYVERI